MGRITRKQEIKNNVCGLNASLIKKVLEHIDLHIGGKIMRELNSLISIWVP